MANRILKFRKINEDIFNAIANGTKKIETRAATPGYMEIKKGDTLTLICGKKRIKKHVKKAEHFRTINLLFKKYKPEMINPKIHSIEESKKMWLSFPKYKEKLKKFGLVVWHLK